jgi:hypothetical protein
MQGRNYEGRHHRFLPIPELCFLIVANVVRGCITGPICGLIGRDLGLENRWFLIGVTSSPQIPPRLVDGVVCTHIAGEIPFPVLIFGSWMRIIQPCLGFGPLLWGIARRASYSPWVRASPWARAIVMYLRVGSLLLGSPCLQHHVELSGLVNCGWGRGFGYCPTSSPVRLGRRRTLVAWGEDNYGSRWIPFERRW